MAHTIRNTIALTLALTLFTVAVPGPIMIDMLGAGLASIGVGMLYQGV